MKLTVQVRDELGNETAIRSYDSARPYEMTPTEAAEAQAEIDALAARVAADPGLPMRAVLAGHIVGMIDEARARLSP